jgi:hypothetical protein
MKKNDIPNMDQSSEYKYRYPTRESRDAEKKLKLEVDKYYDEYKCPTTQGQNEDLPETSEILKEQMYFTSKHAKAA